MKYSSGSLEFDQLKQHVESNGAVRREVEFAFSALLTAANPSDRGLRFLFGNGAEWIIACAAWSAGVLTAPAGHNTDGFDLADVLDGSRSLWSVKASASEKSSQIRLVNFMGAGRQAKWEEPTLFVGPYISGAVYLDPSSDHDLAASVRRSSDALILPGGVVKEYASTYPQNHVQFEVAINRGASVNDPYSFIKSVIVPEHFPLLSRPFLAAEPVKSSSVIEQIHDLESMKTRGVLTIEQFEKAVSRVLEQSVS